MSDHTELVMMDRNRVQRALKRMAYQVAEDNRTERELRLIGIEPRGLIVAKLLGSYLSEIYGREISVVSLNPEEQDDAEPLTDFSVENTYPLVVDDVIFSGQTMFSAMNVIYRQRPLEEIHTAVLVDRGHRKFPVQAQFVGLELSTKLNEHVSVSVENEKIEKVVLEID